MQPFVRIDGVAVALDEANVDTNQICPSRFNKVPRSDVSYPRILFHDQRFASDGSERPEFVLNRAPLRGATVLVANHNFGCGSSRETAVYALLAFGFRTVIAPSFGDIFHGNALRNGLLTVVLPAAVCDALRAAVHDAPRATVAVDLEAQTVAGPDGAVHAFDIHPTRRRCLLEGLDDIALTREFAERIDTFETAYAREFPWMFNAQAE